jgi:hypothetical protein
MTQSHVRGTIDDEDEDTTGNLTVFPDEPPSSGDWIEPDDLIAEPTEEELAAGQQLGEDIDPDDDDSTGVDD